MATKEKRPVWFAPNPPSFPGYASREQVLADATRLSHKLLDHIKKWMDGQASDQLPAALLPTGFDPKRFKDFRLVRPEQVTPAEQWAIRPAATIDLNAVVGFFPDPHCSYFVLPHFYAPFGCTAEIEGQFPHCRYFSLQPSPSFDPDVYRYDGATGVGEVPLVDADIDPLPGHVNPFRVDADRTASKRSYRATFEFALGNPTQIEPAFRPPFYRSPGNHRRAGGLQYQGPWGTQKPGHCRGPWDFGHIWMRYYAPDNNQGPLGGVPLPKVTYRLPDGRPFFITCDWSVFAATANRKKKAPASWPSEPPVITQGPKVGWVKQFGIFRAIVEGVAVNTGWIDQAYVRRLDKGVAGRGEDMPPPGNFEPSATSCTHINYLLRAMTLGWDKVIVLTGRLPTVPATLKGQPRMASAQARYWSITGYDSSMPDSDGFAGAAIHSVMDENILLNADGHYILAFSRAKQRPANANAAAGVTWVDWGPMAKLSWTIRWLSIAPDWSFNLTPHEHNLGWETDWASTIYNPEKIGRNNHEGWLKEYLPRVHLLTRLQFEALGSRVHPDDIPLWEI